MKTFRKYSEMPANNQCAQNFDLGCELHMNPTNQQSHVNIMNLNLSNSDVKSSSYPPVCSDSRLFDTSVNHLLTLDAECCKKSNPYPCIPSCPETPLVSEAQGLFNTLHKVGYTHPRIRTNFNSQTGTNRSHTNDKLLTSTSSSATTGRLQNKSLQFLQTVPHFIYISNPNNQLTNPKDTCLPKNLSTEPIEHAKVINQKCEHILENSHIVCQNLCAHSPSSMCQCNKKPQEDCDISDILFSGGHPTYYPNSQYQCPAHSQLQTAQEYSLKEFLPEGAKVKCDSIASSSANYESGERLANSFSNSAKYMKCCHRLTMTLVCLLIFACLCYRIIDYFNRYEAMKTLFVYNTFSLPEEFTNANNHSDAMKSIGKSFTEEKKPSNWFTITLCNLNPIRGSALFTVKNGSQIYDMISKDRQNEMDSSVNIIRQTGGNNNRVPIEILKQTGHKLSEMLKYCYTGTERCTFHNFTSVLTIYGQCYRMKLKRTVHEVSFMLDSQDYDYIIPHNGLIGFRLWIHSSEEQAHNMLDTKDNFWANGVNESELHQQTGIEANEIIVSTEFQTLIRVALDMNVRFRQNSLKRTLCSSLIQSSDCEYDSDEVSRKDSLEDPLWLSNDNYHRFWNARIISATQSSKATIMYSLLALRNPNLFIRNKIDLERGLRIQQRAYVQLANETAFSELRNLVSSYEELRNQLGSIKQLLREIEIGFWRDQREALQMTHTDATCSKMVIKYFETLINITQTFQDDLCRLSLIEAFYTTSSFNCPNYNHSMHSAILKEYPSQLNITKAYPFSSHTHLSSLLKTNFPQTSNITPPLYDQINSEDKTFYELIKNPALIELQVVELFFSNATYSSKLKDILRKYLKLLSAKRMQMTTRTNNNRFGMTLGSHSPSASSSAASSASSSSSLTSSSSSSTSAASLISSSSSVSSVSPSVQHSLQFLERGSSQGLASDASNEFLCSSQIQIHIDSIYNLKLEKLGESIATCIQRLEVFQTSMNFIIQWNKHIINTFSIDYQQSQRLDETSLVTFTVQIESTNAGFSMTQFTPMNKLFSPFAQSTFYIPTLISAIVLILSFENKTGEIMGICFGTLSLLIPLYLLVDYFFTMKCKNSTDTHSKSIA